MFKRVWVLALVWCAGCARVTAPPVSTADLQPVRAEQVQLVSTRVPFPRGLAMKEGELFVLSRGRVRDSGGTDLKIDDAAGTLWRLSPQAPPGGPAANGEPLATPTSPPLRLLDRTLATALDDTATDRPYCILRFDPATSSLYFCGFSGIDKPLGSPGGYFRKNASDALFRYDLRTGRYYELARGLPLDGPNNCLVVGRWLYAVNKESSTLVRQDLSGLRRSPDARPGAPEVVLGSRFRIRGETVELLGHSMLAYRGDGYLYVGFRTSSAVVRVRLSDLRARDSRDPVPAEMLARFEPYDPVKRQQADLTDMAFGPDGTLYVVGAKPARVWRFVPEENAVFDARTGDAWAELHRLTRNPAMKIEAIAVDATGRVFVTSADRLPAHDGTPLAGAVYRIDPSADAAESR